MLKRTPLYDFHVSCGAKMVDFAGWEMPILYRGIVEEHLQTRASGSLFDVSHMGRIHISGSAAVTLLDKLLTRNVSQQRIGQSRYSLVCNPAGGVLDDVIVSKHAKHWLIVCNASNREKILKHITGVRDSAGFDAEISDQTESTAMVAVQGPAVISLLSEALDIDIKSMKRYAFENGTYMMSRFTLFRSGYTGEDGAEVIVSAGTAQNMVKSLSGEMSKPDAPIKPAGLGARDTLRLEAGMPLYGHELIESVDPISAGLNWAVDLTRDFIGVEPLRIIAAHGPAKKLVGLDLHGPRIARQGAAVKAGEAIIGEVTSGTFSPTLKRSIAMAFVDAARANDGDNVDVDLRGASASAKIVALPFYKR
ncbi:MAG TPA: glycine cleavage system aminomethyltransferase GcvT [Tepidisphaeraceae bacterium]|jgi:aminomethyltransferase|nr:glycine cleavage system aminomethyltransferase GcvT [Tepidisphaeraceae bacterium]